MTNPQLAGRFRRVVSGRAAIWVSFAAVHLMLSVLFFVADSKSDVTHWYRDWADEAFNQMIIGIDRPWVYPILALVPMLITGIFGNFIGFAWLALVTVLDGVALVFIIGTGRLARRRAAAWWWLLFLLLLGPIALDRIDSITVPFAIVGLLLGLRHPTVAAILLTAAAWIKVWPAALVIAVIVVIRQRLKPILVVVLVSTLVVAGSLLLGSGLNIFGFIGMQTGRGLQIEAPLAVFWMWQIPLGAGDVKTYFDKALWTYQVVGPGVNLAAEFITPLLVVAFATVFWVGIRAIRRGAQRLKVLVPLALALVVTLQLVNKVGSPQYVTWLAAPVILGLVVGYSKIRIPGYFALGVAACTQTFYPYFYAGLPAGNPWLIGMLTLKCVFLVCILVWSLYSLWCVGYLSG